jgi:hypothetical protein
MAGITRATTAERKRLTGPDARAWKRWGAYLAERQWGTVREDYSPGGDAWSSFPHDHARSRAYRWGEDGLLGLTDDEGLLCFSLALWNGRDPILKERMFGLTNPQGNHGEDVKECYYYLDATPTASYLKGLYKYPQAAFPYDWLIAENGRRSRNDPEFELMDTGVFREGRYFDVFVEYAKAAPDDVSVRITAFNRGPDAAPIHLLPTLWYRNTWSWEGGYERDFGKPAISQKGPDQIVADHSRLGAFRMVAGSPDIDRYEWLFTENETNNARLYGGVNASAYVKDAFHGYVIGGQQSGDIVNPAKMGTKAAAYFQADVPPGGSVELRLRLTRDGEMPEDPLGPSFDEVFQRRIAEADEFYEGIARPQDAAIARQACAGLIWSKQFFYYAVEDWLKGDPIFPPPAERWAGRNTDWDHVFARDIISMPDKWEFPWFASWDLAFHTVPFSLLDPDFARDQLVLMLREWYMHPSGQLAAYEYNFSDVNPPVHPWACRVFFEAAYRDGAPDYDFLKRVFVKLAINFTWWVNRKDMGGHNLFSGGFLGLDNIGVFDRSMQLPEGVTLEQADSTAWMALFCVEMLRMAGNLAAVDSTLEDVAVKFFEHFASIRNAINGTDGDGLWNEEEGLYLDRLRLGDRTLPLRVRSLVGFLPMIAAAIFDEETIERMPQFREIVRGLLLRNPQLQESVLRTERPGPDGKPMSRWLMAVPTRAQLERMLQSLLDENEFLSPYGIRSMSKAHLERPFIFNAAGQHLEVSYLPGESDSWMFGGNSNWRGPIWMPINILILQSLRAYYQFYGDAFKVEFPTGSGRLMNLLEVRNELAERLISIFRPDATGHRPVHGGEELYASDPHWRDLILFNEYFHGDTGRGCGASHQTGWTGLVAVLAWLLAHRATGEG